MTKTGKIKVELAETFRVALVGTAVAAATLFAFERDDGGVTAVVRGCDGKVLARTDWDYTLNIDELAEFVSVNTGASIVRLTYVRTVCDQMKVGRMLRCAGI